MASRAIITGFDPEGPFAGLLLPPAFRERTRFRKEWVLTLEQYVAAMLGKPIPSRRKQRGSIMLTLLGQPGGGQVVLSARTDSEFVISPSTATAGFNFRSTGVLGRIAQSNINGEWWNQSPQTGIGSLYDVRALSSGKVGTWDVSAAADNTWIQIGSTRTWSITQSGIGTRTTSATFEVGPTGAATADDSATLTASAEVST